jgi:hypothetical protein
VADEPYLLIISFLTSGVNAMCIAPSACHEGLGVIHEGALSRFSSARLPAQAVIFKIEEKMSVIY